MRPQSGWVRVRLILKVVAATMLAVILAITAYAGNGYVDAAHDSTGLKQRADALIAHGEVRMT